MHFFYLRFIYIDDTHNVPADGLLEVYENFIYGGAPALDGVILGLPHDDVSSIMWAIDINYS